MCKELLRDKGRREGLKEGLTQGMQNIILQALKLHTEEEVSTFMQIPVEEIRAIVNNPKERIDP